MDVKLINPFIDALTTVMPQIGFPNISRAGVQLREKAVTSLGVTIIVGFTRGVCGNIAYNLTEDTAKAIASTMMCGMPVNDFDDIAQSAIAEMGNILTATASTNLSALGLVTDISPPSLTVGNGFSLRISDSQYIVIEMNLGGSHKIEINVALQTA